MRVVYLDETGHAAKQPIAAVAGVLLNPDHQWRILADRIEQLKEDVPEAFRDGFVFHATDLFYGGKHRHDWPDEDRWSLLDKLVTLPRELGIPVAMGFTPKPDLEELKAADMSILSHAVAYLLCLQATNDLMVHIAPGELAMIVAEERPEAHRALVACQRILSSEVLLDRYLSTWREMGNGPIDRIKAPPAFAAKEDEVLLQMADACAFVFQRKLNGAHGADRLMTAMFGDEPPDLHATFGGNLGCAAFTWDEA